MKPKNFYLQKVSFEHSISTRKFKKIKGINIAYSTSSDLLTLPDSLTVFELMKKQQIGGCTVFIFYN